MQHMMTENSLPRRTLLQGSLGSAIAVWAAPQVLCCASPVMSCRTNKSVILLWMNGGPSHIDMWDPKPDAPIEIRGPFGTIPTSQPGVFVTEHLPGQSRIMDKLTLIRSLDCTACEHDPNQVIQTGNIAASPRTNPRAERSARSFPSFVGLFITGCQPMSLFMSPTDRLPAPASLDVNLTRFMGTWAEDLSSLPRTSPRPS